MHTGTRWLRSCHCKRIIVLRSKTFSLKAWWAQNKQTSKKKNSCHIFLRVWLQNYEEKITAVINKKRNNVGNIVGRISTHCFSFLLYIFLSMLQDLILNLCVGWRNLSSLIVSCTSPASMAIYITWSKSYPESHLISSSSFLYCWGR